MLQAMTTAELGDDVFGDDPTVHRLEQTVAELLGKEAALFVPSGTMGNQLAIAVHTSPGDEVIISRGAHIVFYESGAGAALSGVQFAQVGEDGIFDGNDVDSAVHPPAYYCPRSRLVVVENTHNRAGGRVVPQANIERISERARAHGLSLHLDGARLWNASEKTGVSPKALASPFDTANVCFSKGLGAPVGSALAGPRVLIEKARRLRKMWGGGMRQSGILAAAALYALQNHRTRLAEDHANARRFAEALGGPRLSVDLENVETNMVNIDTQKPAASIVARARELGLLLTDTGPRRLRAVFHLDVSHEGARKAPDLLRRAEEAV